MNDPRLSDGLARIRIRFVEELTHRFDRMAQLRPELNDPATAEPALIEIGKISHKIAGTAATLGFPTLGSEAAEIDDHVANYSAAAEESGRDVREKIDQMLETIEAVLREGNNSSV
ncbi:Hpt domain-containing protein [Aquicoccus sp. G2-2]|jgi:HPt (histidine-containing phosphotransfer) domain-containing protein|uniref:Hpt domain-containing protein n=1 Tax=Aquicoccus sp. G2-2 TaxID=3092120 RepID=UPI002AE06B2A|nr:Hpt domain-containing protein [Aquicoccus sp. G2-2]MEA1113939.1 Hpt domain-containing protein [Aquicoccus sp. G2-2]